MPSWTYNNWNSSYNDPNKTSQGPIDQGYYVTYPLESDGTSLDPANHSPSGYLQRYNGNKSFDRVYLWITQAQISFTVAGSYAQSPRLRQFFPRNLVQPVWNIQGIVPNSFQLQRLAEFIRLTQFDSLNPSGVGDLSTNMPTLLINPGFLGNLPALTSTEKTKLHPQQQAYLNANPNTVQGKGPHAAQYMRGYIETFSRGAQVFVNVPTYEFNFSVAFSYGDLFQMQDWSQMYKEISSITANKLGTGQQAPNTFKGS